MSALATLGVALSILLWVFASLAFVYAFFDVGSYSNPEEMHRVVIQRAYLQMVFSILAVLALFIATWLSGYTFSAAKVRGSIAVFLCSAFVVVLLGIFIADNLGPAAGGG